MGRPRSTKIIKDTRVSKALREVLKTYDITNTELVMDIGVEFGSLTDWCSGKNCPTLHKLVLLDMRLGTDLTGLAILDQLDLIALDEDINRAKQYWNPLRVRKVNEVISNE